MSERKMFSATLMDVSIRFMTEKKSLAKIGCPRGSRKLIACIIDALQTI
jgi:hypothetical protein